MTSADHPSWPSDDQLQRLGESLREIDPASLQVDPEEEALRWFQGDGGTEIFGTFQERWDDHGRSLRSLPQALEPVRLHSLVPWPAAACYYRVLGAFSDEPL